MPHWFWTASSRTQGERASSLSLVDQLDVASPGAAPRLTPGTRFHAPSPRCQRLTVPAAISRSWQRCGERAQDAAGGGGLLPRPADGDGFVLPRASRFSSKAIADEACGVVIRRNYELLKDFEAGNQAGPPCTCTAMSARRPATSAP